MKVEYTQSQVTRLTELLPFGKPNVVVLYENVEYERLNHQLMFPDYYQEGSSRTGKDNTENYQLYHVIPKYLDLKNRSNRGLVEVHYKEKGDKGIGRHMTYDRDGNYFGSTGGFARKGRHYLYHDTGVDIDMSNCHPRLFKYLLEQCNLPHEKFDHFIEHRDTIMKQLMEKYKITKDQAKNLPLRLSYGGKVESWMKYICTFEPPSPFWSELRVEIENLIRVLEQTEIWKQAPNVEGSANEEERSKLAYCMQHFEKLLLLEMIEISKSMGIKIHALCYDGLIIEKREDSEIREYRTRCEKQIMAKWGLLMPIEEKKMICPDLPTGSNKYRNPDIFNVEFFSDLDNYQNGEDEKKKEKLQAKITELSEIVEQYKTGTKKKQAKEDIKEVREQIKKIDSRIKGGLFHRKTCYFEQFHAKVKNPMLYLYFDHGLKQIAYYNTTDMTASLLNAYHDGDPYLPQWLSRPNIRTYEKTDFLPPPQECPRTTFNLFTGFEIEKTKIDEKQDIDVILKHIKFLCNEDEAVYTHLLYLFAQMVQKPGELAEVATVLHSDPGFGKNLLLESFTRMIMGNIYLLVTAQLENHVTCRFSSIANKFMVVLDEVKFKGVKEVEGVMKNYITAPEIQWEQKNIKSMTVKNFSRFFFLSNDACPVKITKGDRRYFVIHCTGEKPDREYFNTLAKTLHNKQIMRSFYDHLMSIDLSNWDPRAIPMTESKMDLMDVSRDPIHDFIEYFLENHKEKTDSFEPYNTINGFYVNSQYLLEQYTIWAKSKGLSPLSEGLFRIRIKSELKAVYGEHRFNGVKQRSIYLSIPSKPEQPDLDKLLLS